MRKIWLVIAVVVVGLSLGFAIVGCGSSRTTGTGKMQGDIMATDKMGGDKMSTDKMSGDKMATDKMSGDKMATDKMGTSKK